MNDYSEYILDLAHKIKKLHDLCLHQKDVDAYMEACDFVEKAQTFEDYLQAKCTLN